MNIDNETIKFVANAIASILILTASSATGIAVGQKLKLLKNNILEKQATIQETDSFKTIRKKSSSPMSEELETKINEALTTLSSNVSPESMKIIGKNLTSIKDSSNFLYSCILRLAHAGGVYSPRNHEIIIEQIPEVINKIKINYISKRFQKRDDVIDRQIVFHELMHAASSHNYDNKRISGFSQTISNNTFSIGTGINEGYTDLISQKYFCKEISKRAGYGYHNAVAKLTEFIVGSEKMQDLYFHGDLKGLMIELSKYQPEEQVKDFIIDLDTLYSTLIMSLSRTKNIGTNNLMYKTSTRVNTFLYEAFNSKMTQIKGYTGLEYLKESAKFLELFSDVEKEQNKLLGIENKKGEKKNDNIPNNNYWQKKEESKPLVRKKNGYVNILSTVIILETIVLLSMITAYLILK